MLVVEGLQGPQVGRVVHHLSLLDFAYPHDASKPPALTSGSCPICARPRVLLAERTRSAATERALSTTDSDDADGTGRQRRNRVDGDWLKAAEHTGGAAYAMACLLLLNGLRVSEVCGIDIADLAEERWGTTP